MIKVRIKDSYPNSNWNSGNNIILTKDNREGIYVNPNNDKVRKALINGILEIIPEDKKIITDIPNSPTIKEIVTIQNTKELNIIKNGNLNSTTSN